MKKIVIKYEEAQKNWNLSSAMVSPKNSRQQMEALKGPLPRMHNANWWCLQPGQESNKHHVILMHIYESEKLGQYINIHEEIKSSSLMITNILTI